MHSDRNNLDWLAFQYVAGEMNPPEAEAFEARLLDDQLAREAVAAAVELCQAVEATCCMPTRAVTATVLPADRSSATWMVPAAWLTIGAAACLLVVASIQWLTSSSKPGQLASSVSDADLELALAWSDVRQLQSEESETDATIEIDDDSLEASFSDELESEALAHLDAPSWIVNALAEREGNGPLEEHPVN